MRFLVGVVVLVLALAGGLLLGQQQLMRWFDEPMLLAEPVVVDVPRGTSLRDLSIRLREAHVIDHALPFQLWVRLREDFRKFQAGMYRFEGAVAPSAVIQKMVRGETFIPVVLEYSIPEGFTLKDTINRLVAKGVGSEAELTRLSRDAEFMNRHRIVGKSIEGYLFPATYQFAKLPTPEEALSEPIATFWRKLPSDYEAQIQARGLTLTEAVTFASLIEAETAHDDERSRISEVIWNRLNQKEVLGIDASVIYGIVGYAGNITREHLQDTTNPYNLRVKAGLPPGPICSPSTDSLEAVLTPTAEGVFYYVLDPTTVNRHHFSKTAEEHNRWVRKLVQFQRAERRERLARERSQRPERSNSSGR